MSRLFPKSARRAFTLIEVILAVSITVGLMLVAMFFYQQASRLRQDALIQSERVTAVRLLLERLTRELRAARPDPFLLMGLRGSTNKLEFVSARYARPVNWSGEDPMTPAVSDLNIIRYNLAVEPGTTNVLGINRAEEGLLELPPTALGAQETAPPAGQLITDQLHYLRFRFWNGTSWIESWDKLSLPRGLEITVGVTPPREESEGDDDIFQRILYLPGSEQTPDMPDLLDWVDTVEAELP